MLLYIVRHGDPDYATDSLLPRGVEQAEAVGKHLANMGINRVFTSPLGRAIQTAEPLCRLIGKAYEIEPWIREIPTRTLAFDGKPRGVHQLPNTYLRSDGMWDWRSSEALQHPGFEGSDLAEQTDFIIRGGADFLERLGYKEDGDNYRILYPNEDRVALFCHGNSLRVWLSHMLKVPLHIFLASFGYTHTGVTVLQFKNNDRGITAPRCLIYNDMTHLHLYGPDTDFNGVKVL